MPQLGDENGLEPDRAAHFLRTIHDESARLTRLLDSTLDLSLLERGEAPWQTSRIDPESVLESALRTCSGLAVGMRGSARAHRDSPGAGLGLAISWQLMLRFGGSLTLLPGQGPGACFRVALACCGDA